MVNIYEFVYLVTIFKCVNTSTNSHTKGGMVNKQRPTNMKVSKSPEPNWYFPSQSNPPPTFALLSRSHQDRHLPSRPRAKRHTKEDDGKVWNCNLVTRSLAALMNDSRLILCHDRFARARVAVHERTHGIDRSGAIERLSRANCWRWSLICLPCKMIGKGTVCQRPESYLQTAFCGVIMKSPTTQFMDKVNGEEDIAHFLI